MLQRGRQHRKSLVDGTLVVAHVGQSSPLPGLTGHLNAIASLCDDTFQHIFSILYICWELGGIVGARGQDCQACQDCWCTA